MTKIEIKICAMEMILAFERGRKMKFPLMKMREFSEVMYFLKKYIEQKKAGVNVESFLDKAENAIAFFQLDELA